MTAARQLTVILAAALAALSFAVPMRAQAHDAAPAPTAAADHTDMITPHITDAHHLEVPYWKAPFVVEVELPRWKQLHVGGMTIELSPTKHVVMLLLAALIVSLVLILTARAHARHTRESGHPKGAAAGVEALVLYMRNEVIIPNVGPHGNAYVPFLLALFFFILSANLLGLIPYGSTATGNISVTATLALMTFLVVEIGGIRAQGWGYLNTFIYWPHDMSLGLRIPMSLIVSPIELVGKFARPFALAIRLFANMTAGHIVLLAFISLIFFFASALSVAPFFMAVAMMMLELFVSLLQAFIFTLLASVFLGQVREAQH